MTHQELVLVTNNEARAGEFNDVLIEEGERRFFAEGSTVQTVGDTPVGLHVILNGRVLVEHVSAEKAPVALRVLADGDIFGVRAVVEPSRPVSDTVTALDDTYLVVLRPHTTVRLRHRLPDLDSLATAAAVRELDDVQQCLVEATQATAEDRIRARLKTLSDAYDGNIRLSQSTLATLAGTTRPTVNRVLQQLQNDNAVKVQRSRVEVIEPDALVID